MKMTKRNRITRSAPAAFLAIVGVLLFMVSQPLGAAILPDYYRNSGNDDLVRLNKPAAGVPCQELQVHKVGNMHLAVTNYGIFGSQLEGIEDPETGEVAPSCEYPAGSDIDYLFQGALWIGAIVNDDTLCSTGHDGWQHVFEFFPDECESGGNFVKRSTRKTDPAYDPDAISEADYIAVYFDTLTDQAYVPQNPDDGRPHIPLGLEVRQSSYSWSYSYAEDFVLLDFQVRNIGVSDIRKAYLGLYVDADVYHITTSGFDDDICGFRTTYPSPAGCEEYPLEDTILTAWIADGDGDPQNVGGSLVFTERSPTAVTASRVVRSPNPDLETSFNWWVSHGTSSQDWGPIRQENNRDLGTGGLGTPAGDPNKYFFMKNGEFDYDQLWSAVDFSGDGWLPPNASLADNLADGYDTRYLLSFGPFDVVPGDSLLITVGYIAGDRFHQDPQAYNNFFSGSAPQAYYDKLSFDDLATNAVWAARVYDNPGVDTDDDGYAGDLALNPCSGDSIWVSGDGEPDFAGPPPPLPPILRFDARPGEVTIRWNGADSERDEDPFSFVQDFEGYRVYMGDKLQLDRFALLTSWDKPDYDRFRLNTAFDPPRWELTEIPFTLDSLVALYADGGDFNPAMPDFDPLDYPSRQDSLPWFEDINGVKTEVAYYFTTHRENQSTLGGTNGIKKAYPDAGPGDSIWVAELNAMVPSAYEYEYTIRGVLPSQPVYMAVTTIDFGYPPTSLAPLESSPLANAIEIYPLWSNEEVVAQDLKVTVFPNPYKINGGYLEAGYEELTSEGASVERARRIHFANLPREATVRIYTLDGDLVRELRHPDPRLSEGESMIYWDLITKNTQAVVSGIYLYSVESELGNQVGKFVIIK